MALVASASFVAELSKIGKTQFDISRLVDLLLQKFGLFCLVNLLHLQLFQDMRNSLLLNPMGRT